MLPLRSLTIPSSFVSSSISQTSPLLSDTFDALNESLQIARGDRFGRFGTLVVLDRGLLARTSAPEVRGLIRDIEVRGEMFDAVEDRDFRGERFSPVGETIETGVESTIGASGASNIDSKPPSITLRRPRSRGDVFEMSIFGIALRGLTRTDPPEEAFFTLLANGFSIGNVALFFSLGDAGIATT